MFDAYKFTASSPTPNLYRGVEANFLRYLTFYLGLYNLNDINLGSKENLIGIFAGIFIASGFSVFLSHPFDTVRINMQKCGNNGLGFVQTAASIWNTVGVFGFYRGLAPAVIRNSSAVAIYTWLKLIGQSKDRSKKVSLA